MKINSNDFDKFIQNIPENIKGILLYGTDNGYVKYSFKQLLDQYTGKNSNDPFNIKYLNYNRIKSDLEVLTLELYNMSFSFTEKELIVIEDCSETLNKDFSKILENYNGDKLIIFLAQDLSTKSTLRQFFEKSQNYAVIPFYNLDAIKISHKVNEYLKNHNITFDKDIINLIVNYTSDDLLTIYKELEKIILYIYPEKHISYKHVEEILCDNNQSQYQDLVFAMTDGNIVKSENIVTKLLLSGVVPVSIVRSINNYFLRLLQVKLEINSGKIFQDALKTLKPPLFFKYVNQFSKDITKWDNAKITKILNILEKSELSLKQNYNESELILNNLIIFICRIGKNA